MNGQIKSIQFQSQAEAFEAARDLGYRTIRRGPDAVSLNSALRVIAVSDMSKVTVPTTIHFAPNDRATLTHANDFDRTTTYELLR